MFLNLNWHNALGNILLHLLPQAINRYWYRFKTHAGVIEFPVLLIAYAYSVIIC